MSIQESSRFVEYFFRCGLKNEADLEKGRQTLPEGMNFFSTSELYDYSGALYRTDENLGLSLY
jgi:hypothetical protein